MLTRLRTTWMIFCWLCLTWVAAAQASSSEWGLDAAPLADAKLSPILRRRIESTVLADVEPEHKADAERASKIGRIRMGPGNVWGVRVSGGGELCGVTGNCPEWIFDPETGAELFGDDDGAVGVDFGFTKGVHLGHYDIETFCKFGMRDGEVYLFRFEGGRYVLVKSTHYDLTK